MGHITKIYVQKQTRGVPGISRMRILIFEKVSRLVSDTERINIVFIVIEIRRLSPDKRFSFKHQSPRDAKIKMILRALI